MSETSPVPQMRTGISYTTWTAICSTDGEKTGTENTQWSVSTGTVQMEGSGKPPAEGSPTSIPIRKTACWKANPHPGNLCWNIPMTATATCPA